MDKLTYKQKEILEYIKSYSRINSYPPTLKEIAEHFKVTIGTVQDHIFALQKKGYLEKKKDTARGFKILKTRGLSSYQDNSEKEVIPLYGKVAAGEPIFASDNIRGYISINKISRGHKLHFALEVQGDSMIDSGIYNGDIVIVQKQDAADDGDIVIAMLEDEATVKKFRKNKIRVYLEASNAKYKSIIDKPFSVIGKVIELRRNYEKVIL
ncbi:MAG: transcriptional repressor LexA [Ignavibacteria bacterium]|nr:transcriptional repressor LexA [Ignavibacteria bacterium]